MIAILQNELENETGTGVLTLIEGPSEGLEGDKKKWKLLHYSVSC